MSRAFLFHYLMLMMSRTLIHPSSGACDLFVELFHGLYCSGIDVCWCYGVVWLGWCGIRMQAIHPQELATYLLSYFMGCIALVRCVLVLRCGLAGVVWYPDAGSILRSLRLIC